MIVRVVFEGASTGELVRKCKAFVAEQETPALLSKWAASAWPVPSWAPPGSRWEYRQALPVLRAPTGRFVAVEWVAGTAQKPKGPP